MPKIMEFTDWKWNAIDSMFWWWIFVLFLTRLSFCALPWHCPFVRRRDRFECCFFDFSVFTTRTSVTQSINNAFSVPCPLFVTLFGKLLRMPKNAPVLVASVGYMIRSSVDLPQRVWLIDDRREEICCPKQMLHNALFTTILTLVASFC